MSQAEAQSSVEMGSVGSETENAQTTKGFLSLRKAAIRILSSNPPDGLTPKEIYDSAIKQGLVDSKRDGKTPWATLGALFYTDIKAGGATFRLVAKGHFGLTEAALSGKLTSRPAKKSENLAEKLAGKFPAPTTDIRGRPLSPNTHSHGKTICGVKQKIKNGTLICRIPWNGKKHDGDHKFEAFRAGGKKSRRA